VKTKARSVTGAIYGFQATQNQTRILKQRSRVVDLKNDFAYSYHVTFFLSFALARFNFYTQNTGINGTPKGGFLRNRAIQDIINTTWFKSSNADAVVLKEAYKPFPQAALALVLTAVS
jgi:hypothetical protein